MDQRLLRGIRFFTEETGIMSCMAVCCGDRERSFRAWDGDDTGEKSVYDLASVTKLFTGICAMKLMEDRRLRPDRKIIEIVPEFSFLGDTTVDEVMSFGANLQTKGRIDMCPDAVSARECLFSAANAGKPGRRPYSDIPAMVMKYVIERASGMPLAECVEEMILAPAGMRETWAKVPPERIGDCRDYSGEYRIEKEKRIFRHGPEKGVPHDPKAGILQGAAGDLCGHAGLFSTLGDMERFCRAILEGKLLSSGSLGKMAVNRTGKLLPDGTYSQFLGLMCYVRHPDQYYSEIPEYMGMKAFGIGGFTGNHVSVDPERGVFAVFLGNRVKDRLTVLIPEDGKTYADYGLNEDGTGRITREDGVSVPSSVNYVHHKDRHLHSVIEEILGLEPVPFL